MGSIVLDHAEIGADTILGAGSLVTVKAKIPSGVLALGRPAKVVRELTAEERQSLLDATAVYQALVLDYARG
jgi:carbonic anhydrase/acetyltransferase-like protein (isoleucine patch superfamily)